MIRDVGVVMSKHGPQHVRHERCPTESLTKVLFLMILTDMYLGIYPYLDSKPNNSQGRTSTAEVKGTPHSKDTACHHWETDVINTPDSCGSKLGHRADELREEDNYDSLIPVQSDAYHRTSNSPIADFAGHQLALWKMLTVTVTQMNESRCFRT